MQCRPFILLLSQVLVLHPILVITHSVMIHQSWGKKPILSFFFHSIFLPVLRKLCTWLCRECISWLWAELWLASQQIPKCLGFITGLVHNAAFQYFRKPLNWMLFFKMCLFLSNEMSLCGLCFITDRLVWICFGQAYLSAGLKWVFKPPWIFPIFISGFSFQWIDQGKQSRKSVDSILLSPPFFCFASSVFQHSAACLYSAFLFHF